MKNLLRIGLSACFFHPDPKRQVFGPKTLLYFEESMAKFLIDYNAYPILLPRSSDKIKTEDILSLVDGLLLQAGSDISPLQYNEKPIKEEWSGDKIRDDYEINLVHKAMAMNIPILGICRGLQLINIAFGGSLYQDISSQLDTPIQHRDAELYDQMTHEIIIEPNTPLNKLYADKSLSKRKVNTIHHQTIKHLGKNLQIEARSKEDGLIEAIRYLPPDDSLQKIPYVFGVQWHPEYQDKTDDSFMSFQPIMENFIQTIELRKYS